MDCEAGFCARFLFLPSQPFDTVASPSMESQPRNWSLRAELSDTLKLASPIVLNQVGHMSMALVDTMVAGKISTVALAGLGLAANYYWTVTALCVGLLLSL